MKKRELLTILICILIYINGMAQTFTPTGVAVSTFALDPVSSEVSYKKQIDSLIIANSWVATVIGPVDDQYNCHGYAWHMSDGGDKVSIGDPYPYFDNSSGSATYVSTLSTDTLRKIFYRGANQSAVTTNSSDFVISKWGPGYLVRHQVRDCPYGLDYYGNPIYYTLEYYKLNTSGATIVPQGTAVSVSTTLNIANASYNWSGDGNYVCASGTTSTGSVTGLKTTATYGYSARVYVSIYSPLSNTIIKGLRKVAVTGPPSNTPNISGPTLVCSSGGSFTLNNIPLGNTVKWKSSSNLSTQNAYANPCIFVSTGNDIGWVKAVLSTSCITGRDSMQYSVWSGTPKTYISGPGSGYTYHTYTFYANPSTYSNATSFIWNLNPLNSNHIYNLGSYADIAFYNPGGYYQILARAQNTCGLGEYSWRGISIYFSMSYSLSPNPASDNVTLTITEADPEKAAIADPEFANYTVSIYNFYGILQSNFKKAGRNFTLPVSNLKNGNYIVNITNGEETKSLPLVVKH